MKGFGVPWPGVESVSGGEREAERSRYCLSWMDSGWLLWPGTRGLLGGRRRSRTARGRPIPRTRCGWPCTDYSPITVCALLPTLDQERPPGIDRYLGRFEAYGGKKFSGPRTPHGVKVTRTAVK